MTHKSNIINQSDTLSPPMAVMCMQTNEIYLSFTAVCKKLDISTSTGRLWRKDDDKDFPEALEINGVIRYRDSDVERMIAGQNKKHTADVAAFSKTLNKIGG